jgi:protein-L-isoaspartate(D-aspartate) O-methyltransferase
MTPSPRDRLVAELRSGGIRDERVLTAVAEVPRDQFVPPPFRERAYDNVALPIGQEQTISQPAVVAQMVQAVQPTAEEHVLEIGTGSGYGAAVLSRVARDVVTVEIRAELAQRAQRSLRAAGCANVQVMVGDGSLGWADLAPYDAIVVTAASPAIPERLLAQLSTAGGRLVAPVGSLGLQELVLTRREGSRTTSSRIGGVRFVPLIGAAGFAIIDRDRRN